MFYLLMIGKEKAFSNHISNLLKQQFGASIQAAQHEQILDARVHMIVWAGTNADTLVQQLTIRHPDAYQLAISPLVKDRFASTTPNNKHHYLYAAIQHSNRSDAQLRDELLMSFAQIARVPRLNKTANKQSSDKTLTYGEFRLHKGQQRAYWRGIDLELTETEFKILACLVRARGRVLAVEDLVRSIHKIHMRREKARRTLSAHLSNLRGKMVEKGCGMCLRNRRGRGYYLETANATAGSSG